MRRDVYKAIVHPIRRAILVLIEEEAMTPHAIAEHFSISRQAISKHLRILSECKVVIQVPSGREVFYRTDGKKLKEIDHWLEQFRKAWGDRFERLDHIFSTIKNA